MLFAVRLDARSCADGFASWSRVPCWGRWGVSRHIRCRGRGCGIGYSAGIIFRRDRLHSKSMLWRRFGFCLALSAMRLWLLDSGWRWCCHACLWRIHRLWDLFGWAHVLSVQGRCGWVFPIRFCFGVSWSVCCRLWLPKCWRGRDGIWRCLFLLGSVVVR